MTSPHGAASIKKDKDESASNPIKLEDLPRPRYPPKGSADIPPKKKYPPAAAPDAEPEKKETKEKAPAKTEDIQLNAQGVPVLVVPTLLENEMADADID